MQGRLSPVAGDSKRQSLSLVGRLGGSAAVDQSTKSQFKYFSICANM